MKTGKICSECNHDFWYHSMNACSEVTKENDVNSTYCQCTRTHISPEWDDGYLTEITAYQVEISGLKIENQDLKTGIDVYKREIDNLRGKVKSYQIVIETLGDFISLIEE